MSSFDYLQRIRIVRLKKGFWVKEVVCCTVIDVEEGRIFFLDLENVALDGFTSMRA